MICAVRGQPVFLPAHTIAPAGQLVSDTNFRHEFPGLAAADEQLIIQMGMSRAVFKSIRAAPARARQRPYITSGRYETQDPPRDRVGV